MRNKLFKMLFHEDLDIHHRLLNLILSAAFVGGLCSLIITIMIGGFSSAIVTAILLVVVLISLYLSVIRNRLLAAAAENQQAYRQQQGRPSCFHSHPQILLEPRICMKLYQPTE